MADKKYPTLGNHFEWSLDYAEEVGEFFDMPSMVEPVHNLTLEEIVRDYSRGILHPSRTPLYDDGEDIQEVDEVDDIVDIFPNSEQKLSPAGAEKVEESSKTPPAATPESDDSSPEQ